MKSRPTQPPAEDAAEETAAPTGPGGSGFRPWLPLVATVILMPALAYGMTLFVLLPTLRRDLAAAAATINGGAAAPGAHADKTTGHRGTEKGKLPPGAERPTAALSKIVVNVAGSLGTRYLATGMTLVGARADFAALVEARKPQLTDLAAGVLSAKTLEDLEKPGARHIVRSELIAVFNGALGDGTVEDIYITEFAIQ